LRVSPDTRSREADNVDVSGFFSVRLAPGVRVSASSRGLRAHLGPRGVRLHVGGGQTGVSTGAGPVTLYRSLGGSGSRSAGARPYAIGPTATELARAEKTQQARLISETLTAIGNIHRQAFSEATRPQAELRTLPSYAALLAAARRRRTRGLPWWRWSQRSAARQQATADADEELARLHLEAATEQQATQDALDQHWQALLRNDPDTVLGTLAAAFEDNEAPVAAVGVEGAEVTLVVLVPGPDVLPDRYPTTTAAGNLSLPRATRTMAAGWYRQLVAGHAVVSAREAFAVCPGLETAGVVVLRDAGVDVYGGPRARPVLATRLSREALARVRWEAATAWDVVEQTGTDTRVAERGRARELQPLDLEQEPDLARVAASVDLGELVAELPVQPHS
jgi:hypothetical protein